VLQVALANLEQRNEACDTGLAAIIISMKQSLSTLQTLASIEAITEYALAVHVGGNAPQARGTPHASSILSIIQALLVGQIHV
jgi:hypothetical protein